VCFATFAVAIEAQRGLVAGGCRFATGLRFIFGYFLADDIGEKCIRPA
jgi:hypothetical protein